MTKPLKPSEVQPKKNELIPDEMIQAANELLAENLSVARDDITFTHKALRKRFQKIKAGVDATQDEIDDITCDIKWLDIEDVFRKTGWIVVYDGGSYLDTYDGFYTFSSEK